MSVQPIPSPAALTVLPRVQRQVRRRQVERPDACAVRVAAAWGVTFEALAGRERTGQVAAARADLARQLRARTAMSLSEIGRFLGGRDHTTIRSLLRRHR